MFIKVVLEKKKKKNFSHNNNNNNKLSKVKLRDKIIRRYARLHLRRMELANIVSE